MSLRLRTITVVSILSLFALGAIALTGLWHPNAPAEAMQKYLPQITLPTVLVVILIAASSRPTLNRLAHWNLHHKEWVRLALGGGVVLMGLFILVTV